MKKIFKSRYSFIKNAVLAAVFLPFSTTLLCGTDATFSGASNKTYYGRFRELPLSEITPNGWLKEILLRQRNGLGIHRSESGYPYGTCLWSGQIPKGGNPKGQNWWPYEQSGYIVDGLYRCGLLLDDSVLKTLGDENISFVLSNPRPNGQLCLETLGNIQWPFVVFVRAIMADYEVTGNPQILQSLTDHFMALDVALHDREICIIESMCWTYGHTGDKRLLDKAENIWKNYSDKTNPESKKYSQEKMLAGDRVQGHGVTVSEVAKQPAILYIYTGNEIYLKAAESFFNAILRDHELVDGIPSSSEFLAGKKAEGLHETCDISDFTWSMGYLLMASGKSEWGDRIERGILNAGMGAISKDFKSHQYLSSPNQIFSTDISYKTSRKEQIARQSYRPGFDTECCSGNVHRMLPNYAARLWMKDDNNGIVAALYAPSEVETKLGDKQIPVKITEETNYPFSDKIKFIFNMKKAVKFPLTVRIPEWAEGATLTVNGAKPVKVDSGTFFSIKRNFKSGDVVILNLPAKVRKENYVDNGVTLTRGPLVFSLLIEEDAQPVTDQAKTSRDFPGWNITPASPWNYALAVSDIPVEVKVEVKDTEGFPWKSDNSPVVLYAPAKRVPSWVADVSTPSLPAPGFETSVAVEWIKLIPMGSTRIRLSTFPQE